MEEISDSFLCCICLELLYKPVVLCCGHMSCFWCVHRSMNGNRESKCPICRKSYIHFPSICEALHFLLVKMYPEAYKKREIQILEEEKKIGTFSPQIDGHMYHQISEEKLNGSSQSCESAECSISANAVSSCNVVIQEEDSPEIRLNKNSKQISKSDLLCVSCNQLLFRPTVLNCGHVYCQSCLSIPANEKPKCQECESLHPGDLPCVCWELDHFLEDQFPEEYSVKRCEAKSKGIDSPSESSKAYTLGNCKDDEQHDSLLLLKTHFTVGCDYCGMYPIIGDRYKCKGCIEEIGFDLCGDCYKSQSKLPGRFNQQHKPEHKFEHIKLRANPNYLLSLMTGIISSGGYAQFEIATNSLSSVPNPPADGAEDSELDLALPLVFDAIPEDDLSETEET